MSDKYQQTIETFNSVAEQYWEKFQDFKLYQPTYDWFCAQLPDGQIDVLEIACGPGNVSRYLLNKNSNIKLLGIDLAPNMVKLARQHNPMAEFQVMDCRNIQALNQSLDAIMCGFCLPYLSWQDSQKLIDDMCRLLRPSGLLYISTTEGDSANDGFQGSASTKGTIYVHFHEINEIKQSLKQNGMEILGVKNITHIHNQRTTEDVFILARKPT
jgi:ubiquinone/menaquinone biosynthesis C-methylase UbiE